MKTIQTPANQPSSIEASATPPTIYITTTAMATIASLAGFNECDRDILNSSQDNPANRREGYYINTESMHPSVLPQDADIALQLSPADMTKYQKHITFPAELRGVIFAGAPTLPNDYVAILNYWSPLPASWSHEGAQHCQNRLNEYAVPEVDDVAQHPMLSNGIVLCIQGARQLTAGLDVAQYIELHVPVNFGMLGMDRERFDSNSAYAVDSGVPFERIFLNVGDILTSPNPDVIAIAVLHTENFDADFYI